MTSPAKVKGSGFEREVVDILRKAGLDAHRIPLSGAIQGYEGDVVVKLAWTPHKIECKRRKAGFKTLYGWLGSNTFLAFRDDRCEPLIAMRLTDFVNIVAVGEK
jgi:Holliday junction resolvase